MNNADANENCGDHTMSKSRSGVVLDVDEFLNRPWDKMGVEVSGSVDLEARRSAVAKLHELVEQSLFNDETWPPNPTVVTNQLDEMGLEKPVSGGFTTTKLGRSIPLDLFTVFLSAWEWNEIPMKLEDAVPFTQADTDYLLQKLEESEDVSGWLRPKLQSAYREFIGPKSNTGLPAVSERVTVEADTSQSVNGLS